ncbi:ATP-dependent DNA helicase RecQ [beta proteobacterium AAP99]|nr:ATP-dependent DNA helicase RecQ [beta proteobacterium AAP99]
MSSQFPVPHDVALPGEASQHLQARIAQPAALRAILREIWGHTDFRGRQGEICAQLAAGGNALVLMPTGGGKSVCYQLPAIARHRAGLGVALVISPLIALMHDQVQALAELGVPAAFLNSTLTMEEADDIERRVRDDELVLLYAAPERVTTPRFLGLLGALAARRKLSLIAIDEAHCVSQWGHDFRPEYVALNVLTERFPDVPRVALTATADAHTREDILQRLSLTDAPQYVASFDRPNIRYTLVDKHDGRNQLLAWIRAEHAGEAGIVYCLSRKKVEETADWLNAHGIRALPYHAGMDANTRRLHQDRFLNEDGLVMCATIAFGMGIDKPDVRFVAHLDLPRNIEGYYQETGRAGRDGLPADAWMAYGLHDVVQQRRMIDEGEGADAFKTVMRAKLDALLGLAEAADCRRLHLLRYFGEEPAGDSATAGPSQGGGIAGSPLGGQRSPFGLSVGGYTCRNCDNCLQPPATWDATEAAQKALSAIYRTGQRFGAGHITDILLGKATDKTRQFGHDKLPTFGAGRDLPESTWRSVLRQLIAGGAVGIGEYQSLMLTEDARPILRGELRLELRRDTKPDKAARSAKTPRSGKTDAALGLDEAALERFAALKKWRIETARAHGVPAYVIFHDAVLAEIARSAPPDLEELEAIPGIGARKLDAYGWELLAVLRAVGR